ncbi:hypothetical protein ACQP2F_14465 [Actinoplanes sp. CA-030573]|uniref:hypothetical protein n=1 Tax=Actinoplanes sp. CA-030573 TaxID=3239898 RepID=UPI003D92BB51
MGARAVVTISGRDGPARSFWSAWASPEFFIPHLADFLLWAEQYSHRYTVQSWLAYADTYPGTLPREEVTGIAAADTYVGDLDFRYRLELHESGAMQLRVFRLRGPDGQPRPEPAGAYDQSTVLAAAAQQCDLVADRAEQAAARRGTADTEVAGWRQRAEQFRQIHRARFALGPAGSPPASPPAAGNDRSGATLEVAGVRIAAAVTADGIVGLTVDVEAAAAWLRRRDGAVVLRLAVTGPVTFDS